MSSGPASPTTEVGDPVAATSGGAGAPEASDTVGPSDAAARRRRRGPYSAAALFVLPYLLLMLAWAGSNPPGASADEADHLVKALGVGRLHIGEPFRDPVPASARRLVKRNASISRVVRIPARLAPDGFKCTAFHPERTAACLPKTASRASGTVLRATPVGSYPPFLYFPLGFVADLATTPTQAFLAARFVSVLMASLLLFAGAFHLVRWLGRRALLGAFVGLTPMALFASAMVSTGGVEICAAFAVAAVGVVAIRRRESLLTTATQLTLAGAGVALILSRQLGSVAFAAIIVLVVLRIGWRATWELVRRRQPAFLGSMAVLVGALGLMIWWERRFDRPSYTAGPFDHRALDAFNVRAFGVVREGVGQFGWLDTTEPRWVITAWILLAVVLVGMAIVLGRAADRWSLVGWLVGLVLVAYFTYATVFFPINAGIQGRHLLPLFILCPLLGGVVVVDRLERAMPDALRRLFLLVATVIPIIQFVSIYVNARRYAVGSNGPLAFVSTASWHPKLGWVPWLTLGFAGSALLSGAIVVCGFGRESFLERTPDRVEG